jgi:acyl-CoA thioester hydrolase
VDRLRVEWSVPPEPDRAEPRAPGAADDSRFIETARDTIKPWEVDGGGHADWPAHIHRFSAANAHVIAAFGMTPAYMREQRRGFSTFEFRLGFPGALRVGDPVRVRSGLVHVGSSSIRIAHRMTNAATGDLVATLEQSGVHLDMDARRPAPLPDEMRERARAMLV